MCNSQLQWHYSSLWLRFRELGASLGLLQGLTAGENSWKEPPVIPLLSHVCWWIYCGILLYIPQDIVLIPPSGNAIWLYQHQDGLWSSVPAGCEPPTLCNDCWVLMELLPWLLPRADAQINFLVNMVHINSGNGYNLMWCLLALSVPGFDPSIPVKLSSWNNDDIFKFALLFILYFQLQAKKGMVQDDLTCSTTFLNLIDKPMYADAITTLQLCITNYTYTLDDGYLPSYLCLMGLDNQINTNAHTRAHAVILHVCWTLGMEVDMDQEVPIQGSPLAACLDVGDRNHAPHPESRGSGSRPSGNHPYVQGGCGSSCKVPHADVMHVLIGMELCISQIKFAMHFNTPVMLRKIATFLRFHY